MKALGLLLLIALMVIAGVGVYKTIRLPKHLYAITGEFAGCPDRPNCVSSVATDDAHRVAALGYAGDDSTAYSMLREVVERMGGKIEHDAPGYIHAVFVTPNLHLRDDLELLVLPKGSIEIRSISRFGFLPDAGKNRERVEGLRQAFEAVPGQ